MNILITGSTGFIGSNLINRLLKNEEHTIYAVSQKPISNLSQNLHNIICNLADKNFTSNFPTGMDVIIHLAQSNGYRNFPDKANDIFEVNVHSTQLLLEWSRKTYVKKFIFSSTGNVYKPQNKLLTESDICEPIGYYGASKYAAEQLIKPYSQFFETIILRIFGVYGPGQNSMTVPNIIQKIKNGEEITLAGSKGLYFTPLYIDDCVQMLKEIINTPAKNDCNLYNFSGNEIVSLEELIKMVCEKTLLKPTITITNKNPLYLTGDSSAFFKEFKYKPKMLFKTGIEQTIEYGSLK